MASRYKVFVSHSSIDTWVAKQIAHHIQKCSASTFLDREDIDHGDNFEEQILNAADSADELLVLLTPWSQSRPYVLLETGIFWGSRRRIVCVLHGLTYKEIPAPFQKFDLVDINNIDSYFQQLQKRIGQEESSS